MLVALVCEMTGLMPWCLEGLHLKTKRGGHPNLPEGHPLRRHILYRFPRSSWLRNVVDTPGPGGSK
jgi:hypothetical protein